MQIPLDRIIKRSDARELDMEKVTAYADSIAEVGLLHPIRVRPLTNGDYELTAGAHRLEACRLLGLVEIEADVKVEDDLHAELANIDENLMRADLKPSQRAVAISRRKAIYEELHPDAQGRGNPNLQSQRNSPSFVAATAEATGRSDVSIHIDDFRGRNVLPEVMDMIEGTKLDTGVYLDKLAHMPGSEQMTIVKRDMAMLREREARGEKITRKTTLDSDLKGRSAASVADLIAEHIPAEHWNVIRSNLYAAGARNVADALTNIIGEAQKHG